MSLWKQIFNQNNEEQMEQKNNLGLIFSSSSFFLIATRDIDNMLTRDTDIQASQGKINTWKPYLNISYCPVLQYKHN